MSWFHDESSKRVAKRIFGDGPVPDPVYVAEYARDGPPDPALGGRGPWRVWVHRGHALNDTRDDPALARTFRDYREAQAYARAVGHLWRSFLDGTGRWQKGDRTRRPCLARGGAGRTRTGRRPRRDTVTR
jgi:hypothetical protein